MTQGVKGPLLLFSVLAVLAVAIVAVIIADRRDPQTTEPAATQNAPPALDRIRPGASEQEVRQVLGEPDRIETRGTIAGRCLYYDNVKAKQRRYRFCFDHNRLVEKSPQ